MLRKEWQYNASKARKIAKHIKTGQSTQHPFFETAPFGSLRSKSFKISYKIFHLSAF
jgi:hypothetical protein